MTANEPWDIPTCQEMFCAVLEGELSEEKREEFERRMAEDPELAEDFRRYQKTIHLLHSAGHLSAPEELLPSLQRGILRRQRLRLDPGPGFRFPLELLSGILVLAGVLYAYATLSPGLVDARLSQEPEQTVRITLERPLDLAAAEELGLVVSHTVDRFRTYTFCGEPEKAKSILHSVDPTASVQEFPAKGEVRLLILSPVRE